MSSGASVSESSGRVTLSSGDASRATGRVLVAGGSCSGATCGGCVSLAGGMAIDVDFEGGRGGGSTSQAVVALVGAYCGFVADLGPKAVVEI